MFSKIISFLRESYLSLYKEEYNHVKDVVITVTYSNGEQKEYAATRSGMFELKKGSCPQPIPFNGYR